MSAFRVESSKEKRKKRSSTHVLRLDKFPAYFIIGRRGGGKSVLLERMLEFYYHNGYVVLDWNCAFDLESLQWACEDWERKEKGLYTRAYPILIILPRWKRIETDGRKITVEKDGQKIEVEAVKTIYDDTPLHEIIMQAHRERRVCVFSIYLYSPHIAEGQKKIAKFLAAGGLPEVIRDHVPANIKCALGLRELKDLSSNRMLTHGGTGERESKRSLNFIAAQARHARTVCVFDMQNPDDVMEALVRQEDYILVKNFSKHHIPDWLRWLDNEIDKKVHYAREQYLRLHLVSINKLSNNSFYCIHPDGHYTLEHNKRPSFRHHAEADDAKALVGITKMWNVSKEELKQDPMIKAVERQVKQEKNKERIALIQECYIMHEVEGYSYKNIQAIKKVKEKGGELMSPATLQKTCNRYAERGWISLPKPTETNPPPAEDPARN